MNCTRNIITANFSGGGTSATTAPLWQWDYGQALCITGLDLPAAFEVHFSINKTGGVSTVAVGADGQVTIPNVLLTIGKNLNAWIYLSDSEGEGETEYSILIPVKARPMPETYDAEATGEFDDVVRQVSEYAQTAQTAADNAGASATAAAGSASAAAADASSAAGSAAAAEQAKDDAVTAKGQAETAAQTATQKAQQSAQSAEQAASDAGRAESAAQSAESAQTGAEAAKTAAETAAQNAAASASAASASATSAGQSATAAAGSANAAAQSAASIEGDVQIASQKASEAQTAAGQAVTAKDAAVTAQTAAETAATNAGQSASTATAKAAEAATSASGAAQSKTDAEAAAVRAEQAAATLTVDTALSDTSTNPVQNKVVTAELTNVKSQLNVLFGDKSLDSVAFVGKTYREIFETANILPYGDFESGLSWITANTGGATITDETCVSKTHSLKCFGTSSVQIRKDIPAQNAGLLYTACKLYVVRRSAGNCGFTTSFSTNVALNTPTDGFVTASTIKEVTQQSSTQSVFFGTYANANADVYVDDCVCIHLTDLFGETIPTKAEMDALYDEYIKIKNYEATIGSISELRASVESAVITTNGLEKTVKALSGDNTAYDVEVLNGKTYREIFITGNNVPYADFENGNLNWITTSSGNPIITDEVCVSKGHSLKCFGTSSSQIRRDFSAFSAGTIYIACKLRVDRYVQGNCGFSTTRGLGGLNGTVTSLTDGFVTVSAIATIAEVTTPQSLWFGTYSNANADVYIDDGMLINLTSVFGDIVPTKAEMDTAYDAYIALKNTIYNANRVPVLDEKIKNAIPNPIFVGAVLDATSGANRYAAMRELYTVAQKVLDDPSYSTSDNDLTYASKGAVCVLPQYATGMYQQYPFNVLYSKNGDTASIPASTTKVMTLVTGLDYIPDMYERITIVADDIEDGSSSLLSAGDIVTINDLVYAMMLVSSNTAAIAFARVSGDKILTAQGDTGEHVAEACQTAFLAEMAKKAALLGMTNSAFYSPSGRLITNQMTAKDMLRMTIEACSYPQIQKIWNKKSYTIEVGGTNARTLSLTTTVTDNALEALYYIFGGKTGTLSLSGSSAIALVMVAQSK